MTPCIANAGGEGHAREINLLALGMLYIYSHTIFNEARQAHASQSAQTEQRAGGAARRAPHPQAPRPRYADLGLATRLAAALADEYVLEHGPEALMAHRTEPLSNEMGKWLVLVSSGTKLHGGGVDDRSSFADMSLGACFATMARTGFRADEGTLRSGAEFTRKRPSVALGLSVARRAV